MIAGTIQMSLIAPVLPQRLSATIGDAFQKIACVMVSMIVVTCLTSLTAQQVQRVVPSSFPATISIAPKNDSSVMVGMIVATIQMSVTAVSYTTSSKFKPILVPGAACPS